MIRNQKGLTLIELLVALSIASFILWGILHINVSILRDFNLITSQTNVRQVADLAMDQITTKLRKEDYSLITVTGDNHAIMKDGKAIVELDGNDLKIDGNSIRTYSENYAGTLFRLDTNTVMIDLKVELNGSRYSLSNSIYYRQAK